MPTATSTLTTQSKTTQFPLKITLPPSISLNSFPQTSTSASLRSLYTRAARAFVLRDIETTSSLLHSAFAILKPPQFHPDALSDDRKKWDILRITFESTVYSSPPSSNQLPESIRYLLTEAPQALVSSMYSRSLLLFAPSSEGKKSAMGASYLPHQVLTTLVYCSIKSGAPDIGRVMIEDWLARREPYDSSSGRSRGNISGDGYDKVLELYCLHVLPKLDQWDYTKEFLEYESELPVRRREELKTSLQNLHNQAVASKNLSNTALSSSLLSTSGSLSPRSCSPAPSSSSSSSSSVSTTSTHTVVPATPRGRSFVGISSLSSRRSPPSDGSSTSNGTAVPPTSMSNGHRSHSPKSTPPSQPTNHDRSRSQSQQTHSSTSSFYSNIHRTRLAEELSRSEPPTMLGLIKACLNPYLASSRVRTLLLISILIPLISFVLSVRRRRRLAALRVLSMGTASSSVVSNADVVRRRLLGTGNESGLAQRAWGQVVRVLTDTVKMAGSGLV